MFHQRHIMFVLIALTLLAHFEAFKRVSYFQRLDGHTLISAKKSLVLNEKREYSKNTERPTRSTGSRSPSSDGIRQARISRNIRDELAMIISEGDIKAVNYPSEELLRRTSITDVDISPDLSFAKVSISVLGNSVEKRQIFVWLCENVGQVRYSLAKRVKHMKRCPDIFFKLSESKAIADLVALIEEVAPKTVEDTGDVDFVEVEDWKN